MCTCVEYSSWIFLVKIMFQNILLTWEAAGGWIPSALATFKTRGTMEVKGPLSKVNAKGKVTSKSGCLGEGSRL